MRTQTIIVGGGLAGSAAAWALSRRGRQVTLLEQFQPGHDRGSSHGSARIFRRAYADPFYVRLTGEAGKLWDEVQEQAGERFLTRTGALDFGPGPEPRTMYGLLTAQGVPARLITAREAGERWPQFSFDPGDSVLFHNEGGVIDADRAITVLQRLAQAAGATVRHGSQVTSIDAGTGTVTTEDGQHEADVVIVAAGAWLEPLMKGRVEMPELTVEQTQAFHFQPRNGYDWPTFIYRDREVVLYGLPSGSDVPGAVKLGVHGAGKITTADGRDGIPDQGALEQTQRFVRGKIGGLEPTAAQSLTCLYTRTPSEDFLLDRHRKAVIVSACSGHGAKFAPLLGVLAAELACGNGSRYERFTMNHQLSARLLARTPRRP
jgi:sarcosine oxidase